jgi:hypothetical protein
MSKNNLDEMQLQRRNKIGNQTFIILFYLLMIDIGLYGFGFRWLNYPVNVFVSGAAAPAPVRTCPGTAWPVFFYSTYYPMLQCGTLVRDRVLSSRSPLHLRPRESVKHAEQWAWLINALARTYLVHPRENHDDELRTDFALIPQH